MTCPNTGWGKKSKNNNRVDSFIWHLGVSHPQGGKGQLGQRDR